MKNKLVPRKLIPKGGDGLDTKNLTNQEIVDFLNSVAFGHYNDNPSYYYADPITLEDYELSLQYPFNYKEDYKYLKEAVNNGRFLVIPKVELPKEYLNLTPKQKWDLIQSFRTFNDNNDSEYREVDGVKMRAPAALYNNYSYLDDPYGSLQAAYMKDENRLNNALNTLLNSNDWQIPTNYYDPYWTEFVPSSEFILNTWRPVIDNSGYLIGHSSLQDILNGSLITKYPDDRDYNPVSNNCSDSTRRVLQAIEMEALYPGLFTTPGDVRDFALEHGWTPKYEDDIRILHKYLTPEELARYKEYKWNAIKSGRKDFH